MGQKYSQLSLEERCEVARLRANGQSIQKIAASLDRAPSSISRELKRNTGNQVGYKPAYADEQAWARRWSGSRLSRQPELRLIVLNGLARGWSPEQVSGRMAHENAGISISHESIYRFIYAQIRRTNDTGWRHYLPHAKFKRGYRASKGGSAVHHIKNRISIDQRPVCVDNRNQPGHWETDYILFSRYGQSVLVAQERTSRFIFIAKPPSRKAEPTQIQLQLWLAPLPAEMRRTLTQDNGTEFALHDKLRKAIGIDTYFCDPHSPWQKGGIENANGRIRRCLPRNTNLDLCSNNDIDDVALALNNTPRKCLAFKTPAELFSEQLLHFKCESTSRPSPV